jgi:hypothetical protein
MKKFIIVLAACLMSALSTFAQDLQDVFGSYVEANYEYLTRQQEILDRYNEMGEAIRISLSENDVFNDVLECLNNIPVDSRSVVDILEPSIPTVSAPITEIQYYTNVDGILVQSPTYYQSMPVGATGRCADGTYTFSRHRNGAGSHHGGVVEWY